MLHQVDRCEFYRAALCLNDNPHFPTRIANRHILAAAANPPRWGRGSDACQEFLRLVSQFKLSLDTKLRRFETQSFAEKPIVWPFLSERSTRRLEEMPHRLAASSDGHKDCRKVLCR